MPADTREFLWNVGYGVLLPMYIFFAITCLVFLYGVYRRWKVYRLGKPLDRLHQFIRRAIRYLERSFAQLRVILVRAPGLVHAFLFWGMVILFIATSIITLQVDFTQPLFHWTFWKGIFYDYYSIFTDLAGLVVFIMFVYFIIRRYIFKPKGLQTTWEDIVFHALITIILFTGFIIEGARMAVTEIQANPRLAAFSPVGLEFARILFPLGESTLRELHRVTWWAHFFLVMGFIALIPYTKLRHILTTSFNYFFADLREKGSLAFIDLDSPQVETYGANRVAELAWKDIYDADACTKCKRCQDRCPAWNTDKPLSPMNVVLQIGEIAFGNPQADLIDTITPAVVWDCTTCRACEQICPADIEHITKIMEMRRHLVLMEGKFDGDEVVLAVNNLEVNGNPFGSAQGSRADWAEGLPVEIMEAGKPVDVLYFVGCYASFDKRNQAVARNFLNICAAAGVRVGILGKEERCCGEPLRRLGNEYLYRQAAQWNIEKFRSYGVHKVVTTCPHCFNTLKRDYRELGMELEVEHYTVFLDRLLKEGKLKLEPKAYDFTYHDSCYIGRYQDIFTPPRHLLEAAGGRIREMSSNRTGSFCCGGGGGRVLTEEKRGSRISVKRIGMAQATGAPILVSNCPFCMTMFEDGIKTGGAEGRLKVRDLAEVIAERIAS
jgi:Fe-S oxidoreductase/nitrate reductase gamma subunit